jgi:hypothetical protein
MTPSQRALEIAELAAPDAHPTSKNLIAGQIDQFADEQRQAAVVAFVETLGKGWAEHNKKENKND